MNEGGGGDGKKRIAKRTNENERESSVKELKSCRGRVCGKRRRSKAVKDRKGRRGC